MKVTGLVAALAFACSMSMGCGDDTGDIHKKISTTSTNNSTQGNPNTSSTNQRVSALLDCADQKTSFAFEGTVFDDSAGLNESEYLQTMGDALAGVPLQIVTPDGVEAGVTCDDGTFRVRAGVSPFFVDVQPLGRVSSVNDTQFLADAMASGDVKMVVFGDSIPVYGPTPWFPNVLKTKFEPYGDVQLDNVAVAGSRSVDWVPGTIYFDARLSPALEDADVVVFSLGGNDLQEFAASLDPVTIASRLEELTPLIEDIEANLALIIAAIKDKNPDADIVWILYPNYATSDQWAPLLGEYQTLAITLLKNQLSGIRHVMSQQDIVMADMFGATSSVDLDTLLSDPLHLSVAGHEFYAHEIFKTLGGVETDAEIVQRGFAVTAP